MKYLQQCKTRILYPACLYTFLFNLFWLAVGLGNKDFVPSIPIRIYCIVFGYCFLLAASNLILHIQLMNAVLRTTLHFIVNTGLFFLLLKIVLPIQEAQKTDQLGIERKLYVVGMLLFLVVYWIIYGLRALFLLLFKKETQSAEDYKSIF